MANRAHALIILFAASTGAHAGEAPLIVPTNEAMTQAIQKPATKMADRLREVSDGFVGAPYTLAPLGEGKPPDADPRVRWDTFDCTTFVETTIALAHGKSLDDAITTLDEIRYRGEPSFSSRRHFPAAEWIPDLIEEGFLWDITAEVAGKEVKKAHKVLNHEVWNRRKRKILNELDKDRIPNGTFVLDMWPLEAAITGYAKIPAGTVISVVRADFRSVPVRVSHQGLVIEKAGKLYLRHAADRFYHRVVDEPLDHFLIRNRKYQKWPVAGIHLSRVEAPTALVKKAPAKP